MKILLRDYCGMPYVWMKAKYNNGNFCVNGEVVYESNIVSIINDNRKKYIQCSCCRQVFRRGDHRFEIHKRDAERPEICFNCPHLCINTTNHVKERLIANPDGSFTRKFEDEVTLLCTKDWLNYDITSNGAIRNCIKRQCETATEMEINDFFTQYTGAFDDIITVDTLLDQGHDVVLNRTSSVLYYDLIDVPEYCIVAIINKIGIIDAFVVYHKGDSYTVFYSKKYDKLFYGNNEYSVFCPPNMTDETVSEIKEHIAKLYR